LTSLSGLQQARADERRTMKRREFLSTFGATSAFALLPAVTIEAFGEAATLDALTISDVEILKLSGTHELVPGLNRQYQVNPLHLYAERRPKLFKDPPENTKPERRPLTHYYVRIRTKGGVEGLYGAVDKEALPVLLGTLRPLVIGQNALAVERIWDQMYRSNRHSRASHFMMAISYIDNALWDLRGRHFGAPVFRLLGGPTQLPVRVYGSCLGFAIDPPLAAKRAAQLKKDGFIQQKWFLGYGPGDGARGMDLNVQLVRELRAAVGDDVQVMFDAYQGWDLQYAIEWCRKVEQYRPYFVEEAVPMSDLESFIRLSKSTTVPIATGEHLYGRWEAEQFFKADALQFIQADPEWCGGVSETVKVAHLASVHGVKLLPHCHNVHAALHIVASQSPSVCPFGEYLINHVPEKLHFMKDPLLTTNGLVQLSEKPGFGIELDASKVEKQEILVTI
jgi:L-alanine-DL-glutamate epimerase-like enolase superfamily enzyme